MSGSRPAVSPGSLASGALYALVVLAPLLGGSSSLETLSGLVAFVLVIASLLLLAIRAGGRSFSFPAFAIGLAACALFSALQAARIPIEWLSWLSPRAYDIRRFVSPESTYGAISYEVGASWREAAKYLLYAGVFAVALHRGRGRQGLRRVTSSVLVAGLAVVATGLVHRLLGSERIFGVVDTLVPMTQAYTTFSNPNHAAGFLSLAGFCGLGLMLEARSPTERWVFGVGTFACLMGSIAAFSRAGIVATAASGLLVLALLHRQRIRRSRSSTRSLWIGAGVLSIAGALLALVVRAPELSRELEGVQGGRVLGVTEKLAAMQDAVGMSFDHAWFGIGRGAYASLYTLYKTSPLQLTFAFPENIAIQLISEWGLPFGVLALVGLMWAIGRRIARSESPLTLSVMAGVAGLVLHNLLDFSLELPGVAVPTIALLGATSSRVLSPPRRTTLRFGAQAALVAGWAGLLVFALLTSFSAGELFRDLRSVSALVSSTQSGRSGQPPAPSAAYLEQLGTRHPANALLAVQLAYAAETADPPQLRKALTLANRAIYLAPTYAEGYFIAGRVLLKERYRNQGLGLLRVAWSLSNSPGRIIDHVMYHARTAQDVARAIPRTDELGELYSVAAFRRAVHALRAAGRRSEASELLGSIDFIKRYSTDDLLLLAQLAIEERDTELALRFLGPLIEGEAKEPRALMLEARVLELQRKYDELLPKLEQLSQSPTSSPVDVLTLQLRVQTAQHDFAAARATLDRLKRSAPPTYASRAQHALLESRLELAEGRSSAALSVLNEALAVVPEDDRLRLLRAQLLEAQGRRPEAIRDLEVVLRARPKHTGARRALERLKGDPTTPAAPE